MTAWALDPAIHHLNHGSFGGCPRAVLAAADAIRTRLEAAPMRFFVREWQPLLDAARARVAAFVHADPARFAFVPSATAGVATALHSLAHELAPGDELLTTNHTYRACMNQLGRLADERGARIVVAQIALPFDADACVAALTAAITPRTRIALLDHVTSPTALRLPLARLVPVLAARGIRVVIDGAHAPGQLDLDVGALIDAGATYYTGNHHKWLCGPKSSGFLVAAPEIPTLPLVTSHGASAAYGGANRYHAELDWPGTHDPSAHLAVPTAIDAIDWPAARAHNHALALEMAGRLGGTPLAQPAELSMIAMPIALPPNTAPLAFQAQLLDAGFEVPIVDFTTPLLRISAHLYNEASQADLLARTLHALGARL